MTGNDKIEIPTAPPQILSKLFPQTSGDTNDENVRREQQKKEEEEKKEQQNSWKRMKLG